MKKTFKVLLIALLVADIAYSFLQHYHMPFDGDMAELIVPEDGVKLILDNPLGIVAIKENITYLSPNRFFSHWSFHKYFHHVPSFLQHFTNPVDSAYLACALAKTAIQVALTMLMAFFIAGGIYRPQFLLAALIITPLFQTNGYRSHMGIIDPATTYIFFYALPALLLLIYFIPLYLKHMNGTELKYLKYGWIPLALVSSLSGPLNPGISLVVGLLICASYFHEKLKQPNGQAIFSKLISAIRQIPAEYYLYLLPLCVFSAYSLYLGTYNAMNDDSRMPLSALYARLPQGLSKLLTTKLGFPVLLVTLGINTWIIRYKLRSPEGEIILRLLKWIGLFALVYILLLPLGGYRSYRPYVLRYDTILPVTLGLMFVFGKTSLFILKNLPHRQQYWYVPLLMAVLFIFTNADRPGFDKNRCEREAILQIASSPEKVVRLEDDCTVLSWDIVRQPQESVLKTRLLEIWGIMDEGKLFFQK
ncbi:MAG: hypothetical protein RI973_378 [Bacteroidota bacterium]|jgi:hypothetical protein